MPVTPTYPGVYIEEVPSGVRNITGVATSIAAFIGRAKRGPVNEAKTINQWRLAASRIRSSRPGVGKLNSWRIVIHPASCRGVSKGAKAQDPGDKMGD